MGEWIGNNWSDVGTLLFTAVVAWTAFEGIRLNRRLVDAELDPAVTVSIELARFAHSTFDLVIKNAGRGGARNVAFQVEPTSPVTKSRAWSRLMDMAIFERGIALLGPSQELRTFFGTYSELEATPVIIHVTYERDTSARRRRLLRATFTLDARVYDGMSQLGEHPETTSAKALKQIAADVARVRKGGKFGTVSVSVSRRYFFSRRVNHFWNRWFGTPYIDSSASAWRTFRAELRRTLADAWRRVRS